jgi:predicted protein tyrosine phosphatase
MFKLTISNCSDVPLIQQRRNITKILTLIEPWYTVPYHTPFISSVRDETYIQRIGVGDYEQPISPFAPNDFTIEQILHFSDLLDDDDDILIHCWAGKSRSTAAALIILYDHLEDIQKAKEELLRIRPQAAPNRLICKLADNWFNLPRNDANDEYGHLKHGSLYDVANDLCIKNLENKYFDGK